MFSDTKGKTVDETYRFAGKYSTTYERTKGAAHRIAEEFIAEGLPLVIAQPGMIYGPNDTSVVRENLIDFLNGKLPGLPTRSAMCWAHVADTAQAHIAIMERGHLGEAYIIAGEQSTVIDLFRVASEVSGKRMPMVVPHQIFQVFGVLAKPFDRWLPDTFTSEGMKSISGVTYLMDDGKAQRELGFAPRPIREGWVETVRHEMKLLELS